jgi:hypothetical protein
MRRHIDSAASSCLVADGAAAAAAGHVPRLGDAAGVCWRVLLEDGHGQVGVRFAPLA